MPAEGLSDGCGGGRQGEEATFVEAVRRHGREAKLIARDLGTGRSIGDVKKYYQKHKKCGPPSPLQLRTHACTHAATHAAMHARSHAPTHAHTLLRCVTGEGVGTSPPLAEELMPGSECGNETGTVRRAPPHRRLDLDAVVEERARVRRAGQARGEQRAPPPAPPPPRSASPREPAGEGEAVHGERPPPPDSPHQAAMQRSRNVSRCPPPPSPPLPGRHQHTPRGAAGSPGSCVPADSPVETSSYSR